MKFAVDTMLGKLAKWLRVTGQDVVYGPHLSGAGLIRAARREGRVILTRDRKLARRNPPELFFVRSDRFREQLREVLRSFALDPLEQAFSRCLECNALLEPVLKEGIKEKVPPYVFSTEERFSSCPRCRRIYWPATHHQKMLEELRILSREGKS